MAARRIRTPGRQEPTRRDDARRGLVTLVVVAVLLGLASVRITGQVGGPPELSAELRNAGGSLREGADVKIAGVIVGRVTGVSRADGGGVSVSLAVPEEELARVPDNVVARILPATVFGTSFVDLVVYDEPSGQALQAGDVIAADRTQGTLELQQALDDIDRLVTALGPAELSSALGSAAQALDGRGERIGRTIDQAAAYLARLNPRLPEIRTDLRRLSSTLRLVDEVAPDLLQATDDALVTFDTIVTQQASITALITGGTRLARAADGLLGANEDRLVRLVDNAAVLLDTLYDHRRAGITDATRLNILLGERLPSAVTGGYLETDATLRLDAPEPYTAADRPSYDGVGLRGLARPEQGGRR